MSDIVAGWKGRYKPRPIVLSNGETIVVRPVSVEALAAAGTIPLTLFGIGDDEPKKAAKKKNARLDPDALEMVHAVIMAAAVEPRVTAMGTAEGEDSIPLDYILLADRYFLFTEITEAASSALATFRPEPDGATADAPDSEDLRQATE